MPHRAARAHTLLRGLMKLQNPTAWRCFGSLSCILLAAGIALLAKPSTTRPPITDAPPADAVRHGPAMAPVYTFPITPADGTGTGP